MAYSHKSTRMHRAATIALAVITACTLAFPSSALALVSVDDVALSKGENKVGGGKITLTSTALDVSNVTANALVMDESLNVNFKGGNDIEVFSIEGSAKTDVKFDGENEVEDTFVGGNAKATINLDEHAELEEIRAYGNADVTVKVTGENEIENISAKDNASLTIKGTACQKKDVLEIDDEKTHAGIFAKGGDVTIDHVTIEIESEVATIGSEQGNLKIDTSKIEADDETKNTDIIAGGTMEITESVVEIKGTIASKDTMTIKHSDIEADPPADEYNDMPYRVFSETGIELIDEKNGVVEQGMVFETPVWYVTTEDVDDEGDEGEDEEGEEGDEEDDEEGVSGTLSLRSGANAGQRVNLKADGKPAYYNECEKDYSNLVKAMPRTADDANPLPFACLALASVAAVAFAARRLHEED